MDRFLLAHEPLLRLCAFFLVLAAMAVAEIVSPRRRREIPRLLRWTNNLALVALDTAILRLVFPVLAVGAAAIAQARGFGLFHAVEVPLWLAVLVAILVLDLVVYLQADVDLLMRRVKKRGRPFEHGLSREYLAELSEAYNHYFFHYTETPLLVVNVNDLDFVNHEAEFEDLVAQICAPHPGTRYYVPKR